MPTSEPSPSALRDEARAAEPWARATGTTGAAVVAARAARTVAVVGSGRTGAVAVDVLASSGVGVVVLDDARQVRPGDVGVGGLRERHVGRRRDDAVRETALEAYPGLRVADGRSSSPDVVVLVVESGGEVLRTARLVAEGVAHLVVTVTWWGVVVGPFVLPGLTACVRCVELRSGPREPDWDGSPGEDVDEDVDGAEPASRTGQDDVGVDARDEVGCGAGLVALAPQSSAVAALAGALVAGDVLAYLDGRRPATAGASIEVEALDAMPRLRGWSMHPGCGCSEAGVVPAC